MVDLESPASPDELYRYRAPEVPKSRPILQGDVLAGIIIPGIDDGAGLAMILSHACSMRRGPKLRDRLLLGRVTPEKPLPLPWVGHFSVMPLPSLTPDAANTDWSVSFEDIGSVSTVDLDLGQRVACLDDRGICLLNQRHAHFLTRYAVEVAVLHEESANVFAEAELLEEWLAAALDEASENWEAESARQTLEFEECLAPNRERLKDAASRGLVRRAIRAEIKMRFSGSSDLSGV